MIEDYQAPEQFEYHNYTYIQIKNPSSLSIWKYFQLFQQYEKSEGNLQKTKSQYALSLLCKQINDETKLLKYTHPTTSNLHNLIEKRHVQNIEEEDKKQYIEKQERKMVKVKQKEEKLNKGQQKLNFVNPQRPLMDKGYYKSIYAQIVLMQAQDLQIINIQGRQGFSDFYEFCFPNFQPMTRFKIKKGMILMAELAQKQMIQKFKNLKIDLGPFTVGQDYTSIGRKAYQNTFIQFVDYNLTQLYTITLGCNVSEKQENFYGIAYEQRQKLNSYQLISQEQYQEDTILFEELKIVDDNSKKKQSQKQKSKNYDEDYDPQSDEEQNSDTSQSQQDQNETESDDQFEEDTFLDENLIQYHQNLNNLDEIQMDNDEKFEGFKFIDIDILNNMNQQQIEDQIKQQLSKEKLAYLESKKNIDNLLEYLAQQNDFKDPTKIIFATADRFSANLKANKFVTYISMYVSCINHLLNNSCVYALNKCVDLIPLLNKINQIGNFFRQSTKFHQELKKQHGQEKQFITLKKLNVTRWWSIVEVLDSFIQMEPTISKFYIKSYPKIQNNLVTQDEVIYLNNLLPLLKSISKLSRFYESNSYRASFILPMQDMVKNWCVQKKQDCQILKQFKEHFYDEMNQRLKEYYLDSEYLKITLSICTFLDPNVHEQLKDFDKDSKQYDEAKDHILMDCIEYQLFLDYQSNNISKNNNQTQVDQKVDDNSDEELYQDNFGQKKYKSSGEKQKQYTNNTFLENLYILKEKLSGELYQFQLTCQNFKKKVQGQKEPYNYQTETCYDIVNIVEFWKRQKNIGQYPVLTFLAQKYLSIHCSSAQCERNFSSLAYILNKYRNKLDQKLVNAQIVLKSNLQNGFLNRQELINSFIDTIVIKSWSKNQ